jgi:hypothetical protein
MYFYVLIEATLLHMMAGKASLPRRRRGRPTPLPTRYFFTVRE